jgi:ATP-dependent Clp protease ATP-binding subunit ClpC
MMGLTDFNLTPKAKKGLKDAKKFAEANGHSLVTGAHLIYGCFVNLSDSFSLKLKSYGVSLDPKQFIKIFKKYASDHKEEFNSKKGQGGWHEEVNQIILFAKEFSDNIDSYFIGVEHILHVLLDLEGPFVECLKENGIDPLHIKDIIETHVLEASIPPSEQIKSFFQIEPAPKSQFGHVEHIPPPLTHLEKYCINLNERYATQQSTEISGRDKETKELIEILSKKNKSNAILVGEAGVGKTAIVEGLAQCIVKQKCPPHMSLMQICAVDISAMIAGTKYRGEFEERFKSLVAEAEKDPHIILFFDEIHTIIGAGNSEGAVDASNMLKPALARGDIKCVGATTAQEYKKFFEKDTAMKRRFDKIFVEEPSKAETKKMIMEALPFYEKFHHVQYKEDDIDTILYFCEKLLSNKRFPDKAFDLVDQIGARTKIKYVNMPSKMAAARKKFCEFVVKNGEDKELDEEKFTGLLKDYLSELSDGGKPKGRKQKIRQKDIVAVFTEKTGLSPKAISKNHSSFANFSKQMNSEVFGQEENISVIHNALSCAKAGLNDSNKPLSNFLFIGGTSVGKTFTAKKIAKYFFGNEKSFIQLNMSEYQDKTGVSKLIGANAGYVGFEEGGLLTEFVRNNPNSVVLFDEVEKCDPKILDLLLHILDEGYATDNLNREVDFSHTVIVMTSNIGHGEKSKRSMGFLPEKKVDSELYKKALEKHLRPELLARLDEILFFNNLSDSHLLKIIDQELKLISSRLLDRNVDLKYDASVKKHIFNKIKEKDNHARDIKNLVKSTIQVPLSQFLVKNKKIEKISLKIVDKSLAFV